MFVVLPRLELVRGLGNTPAPARSTSNIRSGKSLRSSNRLSLSANVSDAAALCAAPTSVNAWASAKSRALSV